MDQIPLTDSTALLIKDLMKRKIKSKIALFELDTLFMTSELKNDLLHAICENDVRYVIAMHIKKLLIDSNHKKLKIDMSDDCYYILSEIANKHNNMQKIVNKAPILLNEQKFCK